MHSNSDLSKSINLVSTTYIHSSCGETNNYYYAVSHYGLIVHSFVVNSVRMFVSLSILNDLSEPKASIMYSHMVAGLQYRTGGYFQGVKISVVWGA